MIVVGEELDRIRKDFIKKVESLAARVRKDQIIPLCKKHGLSFYSGMGTFFFDKDGRTITPEYEPKQAAKYELGPIFETLNLEVSKNHNLGDYVADYVPPVKRKHYKKLRKRAEKRTKFPSV